MQALCLNLKMGFIFQALPEQQRCGLVGGKLSTGHSDSKAGLSVNHCSGSSGPDVPGAALAH